MPQLYDHIGKNYSDYRKPDGRIAAKIVNALGEAHTVVNVGAGTGAYEPNDRTVVAVEPSKTMFGQRSASAAPIVCATAMNLPFADHSFDTALAVLSLHHWQDKIRGLNEMSRVANRSVIFTWDQEFSGMWLTRDYFPQIKAEELGVCPPMELFGQVFEQVEIIPIPIPHDCTDGFLHAYWRRPEAYFDPGVRSAMSAFAYAGDVEGGLRKLRCDLDDGSWHLRNRDLLTKDELDLGYRLVIGERRA